MKNKFYFLHSIKPIVVFVSLLLILGSTKSFAQYDVKWMTAGSMWNFYTSNGCEIEVALNPDIQQNGWIYPAIRPDQDIQAAKGMWIGAKNFTGPDNIFYAYKVVHVGPRVSGIGEVFPTKFKLYSKFEPPKVYVDNNLSYNQYVANDSVDANMKPDRMVVNVVNTQLGITMNRKIMQFSNQNYDNMIVNDYTFTNTGNTNADSKIELPAAELKGVYFYFQFRIAINRQIYSLIGDPINWGENTMYDFRGDGKGLQPDPPDEQFRAGYSWGGYYPDKNVSYDNIGGPIWHEATGIEPGDTVGRLGGAQFAGVVTLHADKSTLDKSDDAGQPSTTDYVYSDDPILGQNSATNAAKMTDEYVNYIAKGHSGRHAEAVEPSLEYWKQTADPGIAGLAGYSMAIAYGPYDIKPGQSIHVTFAEATAAMSEDSALAVGIKYKEGLIDDETKNKAVFTGRDSLFSLFRRALKDYPNYNSASKIAYPPSQFRVNGTGEGKIVLDWDVYPSEVSNVAKFRIYRAYGQIDSTYHLVYESSNGTVRSYNDTQLQRGVNYYYYIQSVYTNGLVSNRYYTQTYDPVTLKRAPGKDVSEAVIVPNPYSIASDADNLRFPGEPDKLAFLNIPGHCTIKIFTEYGELVQTIDHQDGTGDEYWRCNTSSNQIVVSGLYIAVINDTVTGATKILKFVVIR